MKTIQDICEENYDRWIYDCSGFLKAVARQLGIALSGQANDIIDAARKPPWTAHGHDATAAVAAAGSQRLAIAGLKAVPHGHVAIIMPGVAKPYPIAYWGSIARHAGRNKGLNWAWSRKDLPSVEYFSTPIPFPL